MALADNLLFADFVMDRKFRITTEILEQFVTNPSQDLSAAYLAECTGHGIREITQICKKLQLAGLIMPVKPSAKMWNLVCDPNTITLEDVYRGMVAEPESTAANAATSYVQHSRSVDLLIMQATMEVNQSIFKHLRQFSLGRPRNTHGTHFSNSRR
jgi:DNA-binding IscR family transcriptional regulator